MELLGNWVMFIVQWHSAIKRKKGLSLWNDKGTSTRVKKFVNNPSVCDQKGFKSKMGMVSSSLIEKLVNNPYV